MKEATTKRKTWKEVLDQEGLLILPAAHDALTARLIECAGFPAYQIGGFAMGAAMHAVPDIDLEQLGEKSAAVRNIVQGSTLPVLVDADDGYGDVKNVTQTVRTYEALGVSAIFIEDQKAPARCGHMSGKTVIPAEQMEDKIHAAAGERQSPDFFILARTDSLEAFGVDEAIHRGQRYLRAGADGVYIEAAHDRKQLEHIGKAFKGVPIATTVLEGGGKTPWIPPQELREMGFSMVLYPTTVLFQIARAVEQALETLKDGQAMKPKKAVNFSQFEEIVRLSAWAEIEHRYQKHLFRIACTRL